MRKDAINKVGNFNSSLIRCEDLDLGKRLISHGYTLLGRRCLYTLFNFEII